MNQIPDSATNQNRQNNKDLPNSNALEFEEKNNNNEEAVTVTDDPVEQEKEQVPMETEVEKEEENSLTFSCHRFPHSPQSTNLQFTSRRVSSSNFSQFQVEIDGQVYGKGIGLTWDEAKMLAVKRALGSLRTMQGSNIHRRQSSPRPFQGLSNKHIVIVKMKLMMVLLTWKIEGCLMILRMFPKMKSSSRISGTHL
ncbi:protein-serine/threonine phosphatase [Trifolium repens]|nr:protein-serine/threonine phosphatase [Trifolium repens]